MRPLVYFVGGTTLAGYQLDPTILIIDEDEQETVVPI